MADIATSFGGAAVAIALPGLLSPKTMSKIYGLDRSGDMNFMGRLWASRTATMGGLTLVVQSPDDRKTVLRAIATFCAVDVLSALTTDGLSARTRVLAAATSAAFGAGAAYASTLPEA